MTPKFVFDAHCHIYPDKIAVKAAAAIGEFYNLPMKFDGTLSTLKSEMQKNNVCGALICSAATMPAQVESINDFIAEKAEQNIGFVGFGTMHQDYTDFEKELERIVKLGLQGIKFHPDFQQFDIDSPKMIPIYRRMSELNLPLMIHMGDDRFDYSAPHRLRNVADKVDNLRIIAPHFGGYLRWEESLKYLADVENIYFDTCSSLAFLKPDVASDMIKIMGSHKFFYGSDYPMWAQNDEFAMINNLALSEVEKEKIFRHNFAEFSRKFNSQKIYNFIVSS